MTTRPSSYMALPAATRTARYGQRQQIGRRSARRGGEARPTLHGRRRASSAAGINRPAPRVQRAAPKAAARQRHPRRRDGALLPVRSRPVIQPEEPPQRQIEQQWRISRQQRRAVHAVPGKQRAWRAPAERVMIGQYGPRNPSATSIRFVVPGVVARAGPAAHGGDYAACSAPLALLPIERRPDPSPRASHVCSASTAPCRAARRPARHLVPGYAARCADCRQRDGRETGADSSAAASRRGSSARWPHSVVELTVKSLPLSASRGVSGKRAWRSKTSATRQISAADTSALITYFLS